MIVELQYEDLDDILAEITVEIQDNLEAKNNAQEEEKSKS